MLDDQHCVPTHVMYQPLLLAVELDSPPVTKYTYALNPVAVGEYTAVVVAQHWLQHPICATYLGVLPFAR